MGRSRNTLSLLTFKAKMRYCQKSSDPFKLTVSALVGHHLHFLLVHMTYLYNRLHVSAFIRTLACTSIHIYDTQIRRNDSMKEVERSEFKIKDVGL